MAGEKSGHFRTHETSVVLCVASARAGRGHRRNNMLFAVIGAPLSMRLKRTQILEDRAVRPVVAGAFVNQMRQRIAH